MVRVGRVTHFMAHLVALVHIGVRLMLGRLSMNWGHCVVVMIVTIRGYIPAVSVRSAFGRFLGKWFSAPGCARVGFFLNQRGRFVMVVMVIHRLLLSY
jgi:hypothetical protein